MKNCQETKKKKVNKIRIKERLQMGRCFMLRKSGNRYQPGICG